MAGIAGAGRSGRQYDGRHPMTGNSGRAMRHLGSMSLVVGLMVGAVTQTIPATAAAPTCFGKNATIADHAGSIQGTNGDDVIIGDNGANTIDGKSGADRICGLGGDDWLYGWKGADRLDGGDG